jgi:hypothetical protein
LPNISASIHAGPPAHPQPRLEDTRWLTTNPHKSPIMSLRSALILVCALITGAAAALTYFTTKNNVESVIVAAVCSPAHFLWFDKDEMCWAEGGQVNPGYRYAACGFDTRNSP